MQPRSPGKQTSLVRQQEVAVFATPAVLYCTARYSNSSHARNMGDDGVNVASRHGNNNKQFFRNICASAPGRLIIPSAIVTRHGGENSERQAAAFTTTTTTTATTTTGLVVADTAMPSSAVVEDVGCLSLSEGSQKESVARVHSHSAPAVLLGAPLVNQQQGCSLFWASHGGRGASPSSGRHGSSARRMPSFGLARKSLQVLFIHCKLVRVTVKLISLNLVPPFILY